MNIENIFKALEEDSENSALGIICQQLEEQGYRVFINGKTVSSDGFFDGEYPELDSLMQVGVSLSRKNVMEQAFNIEFTEFHEIVIKKKQDAV